FFQAEDGIRFYKVTGVQTCALPIYLRFGGESAEQRGRAARQTRRRTEDPRARRRADRPLLRADAVARQAHGRAARGPRRGDGGSALQAGTVHGLLSPQSLPGDGEPRRTDARLAARVRRQARGAGALRSEAGARARGP